MQMLMLMLSLLLQFSMLSLVLQSFSWLRKHANLFYRESLIKKKQKTTLWLIFSVNFKISCTQLTATIINHTVYIRLGVQVGMFL